MPAKPHHPNFAKARAALAVLLVLTFSTLALSDDRTIIRPAFNIFSPQQDVEIGERAVAAVPRQYPLLNDKRVDDYLQQVGMRLVAHVPKGTYPYPYKYRCVNSAQINAFALPGGFIYINRGVIENADNEAQLAGVMAHETAHVVLRHGTAQASKSAGAQVALGIVGALVGGNLAASLITQLFSSAAVPLVFLKMSRTDESQADILGTQILHDAGYDPEGMADLFKKLDSSAQPPQFFSDHPNPANRIQRIDEEVDRLGRPLPDATRDTSEFDSIKAYVKSLPPPPQFQPGPRGASEPGAPESPSASYVTYSGKQFSFAYPDNWRPQEQSNGGVFLSPPGGVVQPMRGDSGIAYGVIVSTFAPQQVNGAAPSLDNATQQLIASLKKSNPHMKFMRQSKDETLGGSPSLSTYLQSNSPDGGREADWLVTTLRPDGLFYALCIVPQKEYDAYAGAFRAIVHSVKFSQ
ncbi:MAG TPA: M48 family metallopeptidase [Candidatus Acidoferrales bacterium]|nr:M48 family metallopeptidase [Candidatus Acidoferrales bacterium]